VFSFKLRGAYNKMAHLSAEQLARGVICASAGNHAQGVALAARKLGCRAVIVMPVTTPQAEGRRRQARSAARWCCTATATPTPTPRAGAAGRARPDLRAPVRRPDVIAGQGTVAMEILRQHQGPIDAVFVAIGGGGLISGVAAYIKAVRPEIQVIGVQTTDSDAMLRSVRAGQARDSCDDVGLFSDGTAVKLVGEETFRSCASWSTTSWSSTPTPSAPRSRTCSRTRAASSSRPARWAWRPVKQYAEAHKAEGPDLRRHHLRRQHELRPPALRRRARRVRRAARGAVRGDDPRGARQLPALLRADRPAQRDRVQLPHLRRARGACVRRHLASPRATRPSDRAQLRAPRLRHRRPDRRRAGQGARAPHGRRAQRAGATSGCSASSSPSGRAR
jgi:hypothetical protein